MFDTKTLLTILWRFTIYIIITTTIRNDELYYYCYQLISYKQRLNVECILFEYFCLMLCDAWLLLISVTLQFRVAVLLLLSLSLLLLRK